MTYPRDGGKKHKRTFIPLLAYGTVSVGLSVVPLLSAACSSNDGTADTHTETDAVFAALQDANASDGVGVRLDDDDASPSFSDAAPMDAVYPYIAPDAGPDADASDDASDGEALDAANAGDASDAGDGAAVGR